MLNHVFAFGFFFSPPLHLLWDDMGRYLGQPVAFQLNISPCSMVVLWCFVCSLLGLASVMCCTPILMLCLNNFLWVFHCHLGTTLLVLLLLLAHTICFLYLQKKLVDLGISLTDAKMIFAVAGPNSIYRREKICGF